MPLSPPELLAPAGEPDAGYAALHYGADAVYLGLNRFSARAEAVNFTPDELGEFAAYAHSLAPARKVYLTLNTLIKQSELAGAAETLLIAAECGVDAVIVQDLGVARLARERFPGLRLHASTQMAIHNREGALAAQRLGYHRVTLARELTLEEVRAIAGIPELEVETFIHGTLCYSYSGLCLFSSMVTGRSGNRGRCVYSCREAATGAGGQAHPFSLKDMALGERVLDLAKAGVSSLKIEGRKKSPLYVAATVAHYRKLLDGKMSREEAEAGEARLKTIFARPWTKLFLDGRHNPDAADPEVVGHRGSRIGRVERIIRTPAGPGVVFHSSLPVERHDGLQVDMPGQARPLGFPVDNLYVVKGKRLEPVFEAGAGQELAAALPEDAPELAPGLPLYLASSQAVKRSFPFFRPKAGEFGPGLAVNVTVALHRPGDGEPETGGRVVCLAEAAVPAFLLAAEGGGADAGEPLCFTLEKTVAAFPARDAGGAEQTARAAFERTGGSIFRLAGWSFENPAGLFVRPGEWNALRREALAGLTAVYKKRLAGAGEDLARRMAMSGAGESALLEVLDELSTPVEPGLDVTPVFPGFEARRAAAVGELSAPGGGEIEWGVFAEEPAYLSAFAPDDFSGCGEITIGVPGHMHSAWRKGLEHLAERLGGNGNIRLALPLIERFAAGDREKWLDDLWRKGWRRWLVPGLAGWRALADRDGADLAADWPLYILNRYSAEQLFEMGFSAFTLSPEDGSDNMGALLDAYAAQAWLVVYSDVPLFISAACAHGHGHLRHCPVGGRASARGGCPEGGRGLRLRLERSGGVEVWPQACGSVVVGDTPYSLADRLDAVRALGARRLRVDLRWKGYEPDEALAIWRKARAGTLAGTCGNFERGLL